MRSLGILLALVVLSCASGPRAGVERGNCYGNGSCDPGLMCLSNLCVRPAAPPVVAAPAPDTRDRTAECKAIYQHMSDIAKMEMIPSHRDLDRCKAEELTPAQVQCMMDAQKIGELAACDPHSRKHDDDVEYDHGKKEGDVPEDSKHPETP